MLTIMLEEKYVVFQTGFSTDAGSTATHTEDSSTQFLELHGQQHSQKFNSKQLETGRW
jgi:hypothetical protein